MVGLLTKHEAGALLACLVLEIAGLSLMLTASVLIGAALVIVGAVCQIAVAVKFRARRRADGTWRTNRV